MRVSSSSSVYAYQKLESEQEGIAIASRRDEDQNELNKKAINLEAKKGAILGFKVGSALTVIGIPLSNCLSDTESKSRRTARTAKKRLPLMTVVFLPATVVGLIGAAIGGAIGAISGRVKTYF